MKYYKYVDLDGEHIVCEQEIIDQYYDYWYDNMCKKFGKEVVDQSYRVEDCIDDWKVVNWAQEVPMNEDHPSFGVHDTHCCVHHGCKYGDDDCPVEHGISEGIRCESCYDMHNENLELIARIKTLQIYNNIHTIDELCSVLEHEFD